LRNRSALDVRDKAINNGFLQRGWEVDLTGAAIIFAKKGEEQVEIPKEKLISQSLAYARELEQII
jgi:26S proteasome regulatory subunit N12